MKITSTSRLIKHGVAAVVLMLGGISSALAADPFPSKVVRIVVPTVAGGQADVYGRLVAKKMSEKLGQQVIGRSGLQRPTAHSEASGKKGIVLAMRE